MRDSCVRELLRRKKEKSGSGAPTGRKQYTCFDQIRFLETAVKPTKTSAEEEDVKSTEQMGKTRSSGKNYLPTFFTLFKNFICIKTSVCPNITLVGYSVPILKHSHIQNNVSNKRIVGSS
jgi:hypothetical protein